MIKLRGRIISKVTRQPIAGVVVGLRRLPGTAYETVTVDADGEFDHTLFISGPGQRFEMKIDKDAGYRYKIITFVITIPDVSKDFGEIELEPYTVLHPEA